MSMRNAENGGGGSRDLSPLTMAHRTRRKFVLAVGREATMNASRGVRRDTWLMGMTTTRTIRTAISSGRSVPNSEDGETGGWDECADARVWELYCRRAKRC
ncbi:hypothetical protein KC361_g67 [Hortaea werneckii]|nr:hypothetical protein KC361_g67 [Hortaea werneckii]